MVGESFTITANTLPSNAEDSNELSFVKLEGEDLAELVSRNGNVCTYRATRSGILKIRAKTPIAQADVTINIDPATERIELNAVLTDDDGREVASLSPDNAVLYPGQYIKVTPVFMPRGARAHSCDCEILPEDDDNGDPLNVRNPENWMVSDTSDNSKIIYIPQSGSFRIRMVSRTKRSVCGQMTIHVGNTFSDRFSSLLYLGALFLIAILVNKLSNGNSTWGGIFFVAQLITCAVAVITKCISSNNSRPGARMSTGSIVTIVGAILLSLCSLLIMIGL